MIWEMSIIGVPARLHLWVRGMEIGGEYSSVLEGYIRLFSNIVEGSMKNRAVYCFVPGFFLDFLDWLDVSLILHCCARCVVMDA